MVCPCPHLTHFVAQPSVLGMLDSVILYFKKSDNNGMHLVSSGNQNAPVYCFDENDILPTANDRFEKELGAY